MGTKIDLLERRKVSREEGEAFARERNLLFAEVSAKTGEGVESAFASTASAIVRKVDQGLFNLDDPSHGVKRAEQRRNSVIPSIPDASSRRNPMEEGGWCC